MVTQKFRVYNPVRESFLSSEVTAVDTTTKHLKTLIEYLAVQAHAGLWLKPYRGIPEARGLPLFDLVYLDEHHRVIQEIESYPNPNVKPFKAQAASALVLPARTIFASHTQSGDRLEIRIPEEMGRLFEVSSRRIATGPVAKDSESPTQESPDTDAHVPFLVRERSRQLQLAIQHLNDQEDEALSRKNDSLKTRFLRWLNHDQSERRRARRHPLPGLVAYHWTGGAPQAYHIGDISETGIYLLTDERPLLGTMILMTLQRTDGDGENPEDSIAVHTRVVRWGADGVGLAFVLARFADIKRGEIPPENGADPKALEEFMQRLSLPQWGKQQKIGA